MKIAIMTTWSYKNNYGSVLQGYALQKYLQDAGHDAYLIRYYPSLREASLFRRLMSMSNPIKEILLRLYVAKSDRRRRFDEFRKVYIRHSLKLYHSYEELKSDPPVADVYVVGSDQVWKVSAFSETKIRAFFLDFGDTKTRKIAWAASFGTESLTEAHIQKISHLMKQFEYISVRERSGIEICKKCGIENAEWIMDPALLLDINVYRSLYENVVLSITKPKGAFCFLYLLDGHNYIYVNKIYKWASMHGLSVVYVTGNSYYNMRNIYATIPEWIYLLENCKYVITDSYHSMIFSVIFQKDFFIIPRMATEQNDRFWSFFELLELEHRFISNDTDFSFQDKQISWDSVHYKLDKIKKMCMLKFSDILENYEK